jgi:hypothetical protein
MFISNVSKNGRSMQVTPPKAKCSLNFEYDCEPQGKNTTIELPGDVFSPVNIKGLAVRQRAYEYHQKAPRDPTIRCAVTVHNLVRLHNSPSTMHLAAKVCAQNLKFRWLNDKYISKLDKSSHTGRKIGKWIHSLTRYRSKGELQWMSQRPKSKSK